MTTDEPRKYQKRGSRSKLEYLAIGLIVVGVVLFGIATNAYLAAKRAEQGVRGLFFEFCLKRSSKFQADADAKKICEDIWQGALKASNEHGVIVSPFLLARVIEHESGFCRSVISPTGDFGCAQINLAAHGAAPFGCDILAQKCNIAAGAMILGAGLKQFGGSERLALYAYNRGA